jgi:predicted Zn-dependent peptidase
MTFKRLNPAWGLCLALLVALPTAAAENPQIEVEELVLDNGMKWLLYENPDSPTVLGGWTALVGSVNERPGITGLSHFFEHMMFKGTRTIGTKDIEADLRIIDEQERVQAQMRDEMTVMRARLRRGEIDNLTSPRNWTPRYRELKARFDELVKQQRAITVSEELERIYTRNGGEFTNAGTTEDFTMYFVRVPANRLELWAWLESDRLLNPVFREFYSERDVVYEERRRSVESTPLGKFDEAFNALFWEALPYTWPVVGWPSDIPNYTLAQAKSYFATYYAPNNIVGVLAGDFRTEEVKPLLERYFGRIPRGEVDPPQLVTLEPRQIGEKRYNAEAETSPTVRIWWKGVPFVHRDMPVLDLLSDVMRGRTGRLYKGLVDGRKIANQVSASLDAKKYDGIFMVECTVKDGVDPAEVEAAVYEEIARLQNDPIPAEELQKVKNGYKAYAYRRLTSPTSIGIQLLVYTGWGDWRYINTSAAAIDAVTAAELQRAAQEYLVKEHRTVGVFLRKEGAPPEDAEVAALPPPAQTMVRQTLKQLESLEDPAQLQQMIGQMEQAADQAPPEMKPAIDLILKRARERLDVLTGAAEEASK